MPTCEFHFFYEFQCLYKFFVSFAGEARNNIGPSHQKKVEFVRVLHPIGRQFDLIGLYRLHDARGDDDDQFGFALLKAGGAD